MFLYKFKLEEKTLQKHLKSATMKPYKMNYKLPKSVENVLWSYDLSKIDLNEHKKLIIAQVLNYGTQEATNWLFETYGLEEIREIAQQIPSGQWDRKSLSLWSLCLDIKPKSKLERVLNG